MVGRLYNYFPFEIGRFCRGHLRFSRMYPKWPPKGKKKHLFQHHFRSIIFGLHVNVFATEAFAKNFKFPPGSEVCLKGKNDVKITGGFMGYVDRWISCLLSLMSL